VGNRDFRPIMSKNAAVEKPVKTIKGSRATGRVTIVDVASEAGVSPMTVSRAL